MAVFVTFETLEAVIDEGAYVGFCLACGEPHEDAEPDARRYECDACGAAMVFGAEELLLMEAYVGGTYKDGDESL